MKDNRIAILGAGGVGVCAALELAGRGHKVDLYDEGDQAITRASENNEGKIHLGLVYAKDPSLQTARTMVLGAIHFAARLNRWIDVHPYDISTSTPFHYAVHNGTMISTDELETHYNRCKKLFEDACSSTGLSYLGVDRTFLAEKTSPEGIGEPGLGGVLREHLSNIGTCSQSENDRAPAAPGPEYKSPHPIHPKRTYFKCCMGGRKSDSRYRSG